MKIKTIAEIIFGLGMVSSFAWSEGTSQLNVQSVKTEGSRIVSDVSLVNYPSNKVEWRLRDVWGVKLATPDVVKTPVNLWILVDSSQLCHTYQIEPYLEGLIGQLKAEANPATRISVATFTSTTLEVLQYNRILGEAAGDAETVGLKCDSKLVSSTYEKALKRMLELQRDSGMRTAVWVFTSGNIQLSNEFLNSMRRADNTIQVILYNAIMEQELQGLVAAQNAKVGREAIHLSQLDPKSIPERWYSLDFAPSAGMKGSQGSVTIAVSTGEKGATEIVKRTVNFDLPKGGFRWGRFVVTGLLVLIGIGSVAWGLYQLFVFYRPRFCKSCQRRMRYTDRECGFCAADPKGFLVGDFNQSDPQKRSKDDVYALSQDITEIGTKRRCGIHLLARKGKSKEVIAKIERQKLPNGECTFRVIPTSRTESVMLRGKKIDAPKNLAPGDQVVVQGISLFFVYGRTNHG